MCTAGFPGGQTCRREGGGDGDSLLSIEFISKPSALPKPSKMPWEPAKPPLLWICQLLFTAWAEIKERKKKCLTAVSAVGFFTEINQDTVVRYLLGVQTTVTLRKGGRLKFVTFLEGVLKQYSLWCWDSWFVLRSNLKGFISNLSKNRTFSVQEVYFAMCRCLFCKFTHAWRSSSLRKVNALFETFSGCSFS